MPGRHTLTNNMAREPFVSIIMPIRNEASFIEAGLAAILNQDYPLERMEVLVVDGMSDDGTREIIQHLIADHSRISMRMLDNPRRIIPTGLNIAIQEAKGDVIVRVDGHTLIPHDYISEGVATLIRTGADNVGGLAVSFGQGRIGETIAIAERLRFGLGGALFRRAQDESEADTVYMGIFRRDVFGRIGLYDEALARNQDIELNSRIRRAGGRIVLSPRIRATYFCRNSLRDLWKQNYANGLWLFPTIERTPHALSFRHYIPMTFVCSLLASMIMAPVIRAGRLMMAAITGSYILAAMIASIMAATRYGRRLAFPLPIVFATMHFSYGIGSLIGLYRKMIPGIARFNAAYYRKRRHTSTHR
jgi:succinoglycan biosynthesis protein ExoA